MNTSAMKGLRARRNRRQPDVDNTASDDTQSGDELQAANTENGATTTTTTMTMTTPAESAAATGRREKRRMFRANRVDRARSASNSLSPTRPAQHGDEDDRSEDRSDDRSDDTVGSLPENLMPLGHLRGVGDDAEPMRQNAHISRDYVPPTIVPGAVYTRGRAIGQIPEWAFRDGPAGRPPNTGPIQRHNRVTSESSANSPGSDRLRLSVASSIGSTNSDQSNHLGNSSHNRRGRPSTFRGISRQSTNILRGSVRNLFTSFRRSSSLPEAEALDSEKVVYAEILDEDELAGPVCSLELVLYSLFLLVLGILIGRMTANTVIL